MLEAEGWGGNVVPVGPLLGLATCEGDQVRQAEAVGQDDEFHVVQVGAGGEQDRKSTRLNSSH